MVQKNNSRTAGLNIVNIEGPLFPLSSPWYSLPKWKLCIIIVSSVVFNKPAFCCFSQAINLLPANTQISEIRVFLESVLEEKAQRKRCNQVLKSLLQAEFLRVSPAGLQPENRLLSSFKPLATDESYGWIKLKKMRFHMFYKELWVLFPFCLKPKMRLVFFTYLHREMCSLRYSSFI